MKFFIYYLFQMNKYRLHSASLVFVKNGCLLLSFEERKSYPTGTMKQNHMIGGKIQKDEDPSKDENPFVAACREFIEEVAYPFSPKRLASELYSAILKKSCYEVSKPKRLLHVFYFINVEDIVNEKYRNEISNIVETFDGERSELLRIFWHSLTVGLPNCSSLCIEGLKHYCGKGSIISYKINDKPEKYVEKIEILKEPGVENINQFEEKMDNLKEPGVENTNEITEKMENLAV